MANRVSADPNRTAGHGVDLNPPQVVADRAPTSTDKFNDIGTLWVDKTNNASYQLTSVVANVPNWQLLGSDAGAVGTINSNAPVSGNYTLAGTANQVTATDTAGTTTFSLADGVPKSASVSLTAAQIKALATTPITLVAAPGAGKVVQFMGAQLKLVYGGNSAFTGDTNDLGIKYTDASGVQVSNTIDASGFISATANTYNNAIPAADAIVAATGAENQALVLDNLGSNYAGNADDDNTLEISVVYRVVTL